MNPEQWKRVEELFERAAKLPEGQWPAFLVSQAGDDLDLIETVLKMLRSRGAEKFIEPPSGSSEPPKAPGGQAWEGRKLGDFELKESIGRGGMGLVFRARQISLQRDVAVKLLPFESLERPDRLARFTKEARAAARLHHPHVVPIYAVGQEGEVRWFAMELIEGPDLAREIKRLAGKESGPAARLPPFESREYLSVVVRLVEQAADALAYAHQNGIVHRDIKPHNLLVDPAGQVRVVDFGLARDETQGTITTSSDQLGSPYYMSPEQVRHRMHGVDARTDIYSLGVVFYELLTLRRPFEGHSSAEVWHRIVHDEPPTLRKIAPRVPNDLAVVCHKAMARELADRYASAADFRDDLRRFLSHESVLARPPSPWRRAQRFGKRHAVVCGSTATAAVAISAGFLFADLSARHRAEAATVQQIRTLLDEQTKWDDHLNAVVAGRRVWVDLHAHAESLSDELRRLERELGDKFDADYETRRRQLEQHLVAGFGGTHDSERFDGHGAPPSTAELSLFLSEGERMKAIYGDRPEVDSICAVERTKPHVNLHLDAATEAAAGGVPARASLRLIEPLLGTRGEKHDLGVLPRANVSVPPGNVRLVVEIAGFGFAEYTRFLLPRAEPYDFEIRVRRDESAQVGMKLIDAGRYTFDSDKRSKCDIFGRTADFEAFWIDEADVSNREFVRFLEDTSRHPPKRWAELGYAKNWHDLPIGGIGDRFLDLPAAFISYGDAQAYAEWAGKRLATHIELERALRGIVARLYPNGESELPSASDNYNVYGRHVGTETTLEGDFQLYLDSVKPVRDPQYRQPPEGLFHAFGNVGKLSESLLAEPDARDVLEVNIGARVGFAAAWDAKALKHSLWNHAIFDVGERRTNSYVGIRCCKSRSP